MDKKTNPSLFVPIPRTIRTQKMQSSSLKTLITVRQPTKGISKPTSSASSCSAVAPDSIVCRDLSRKLRKEASDDEDGIIIINQADCDGLIPLERRDTKIFIRVHKNYKELGKASNTNLLKPALVGSLKI